MITVIISKNGEVIREASGDFAFGAVVTERENYLHMQNFLNGECDVSDLAACCAENVTKIIRVSTEGNPVAAHLLQMVIAQLEKKCTRYFKRSRRIRANAMIGPISLKKYEDTRRKQKDEAV